MVLCIALPWLGDCSFVLFSATYSTATTIWQMSLPAGDDDSLLPALNKNDDSLCHHRTISSQPHPSCFSNPQLGELSLDLVKAATGQFDALAITKFTWCNKALAVRVHLQCTLSQDKYVRRNPNKSDSKAVTSVRQNLLACGPDSKNCYSYL